MVIFICLSRISQGLVVRHLFDSRQKLRKKEKKAEKGSTGNALLLRPSLHAWTRKHHIFVVSVPLFAPPSLI
jgi:hypothetical protein